MNKPEWQVTDNDLKKIWDDEQGSPHVETAITFAQKKLLEYLRENWIILTQYKSAQPAFEEMIKQLEGNHAWADKD